MNELDKAKIVHRYEERVDRLGAVAAALGEPKQRQHFYFHFLLDTPAFWSSGSVLDVGCGYGDLHAYLRQAGWQGRYLGVDIVPKLIEAGRKKHPDADLRVLDVENDDLDERFDWVVSVHALTSLTERIDYFEHLRSMLAAMWSRAERGMSFNLFSPFVDYRDPLHAHPDVSRVLEVVTGLTRRFVLRNDYMPYEYALHLFKNDTIDPELTIFSSQRPVFERRS